MNLTRSIIARHLVSGDMTPGAPIGLRIDQTLTQDATGTMAWLQFEALGLEGRHSVAAVRACDEARSGGARPAARKPSGQGASQD